jgi:hypothetical protein
MKGNSQKRIPIENHHDKMGKESIRSLKMYKRIF